MVVKLNFTDKAKGKNEGYTDEGIEVDRGGHKAA